MGCGGCSLTSSRYITNIFGEIISPSIFLIFFASSIRMEYIYLIISRIKINSCE